MSTSRADLFVNPAPRALGQPGGSVPLAWHRGLPGYAPTPLHDMPALAASLGIGRLWVKDESERCGLPSFKILGASYATARTLSERLGHLGHTLSLAELRAALAGGPPITLVTATDGNHGRAVAHVACLLGAEARILVPAGTAQARIAAITAEGAQVDVVDGSYDEAVAAAARLAGEHCVVVSDTAWPGYQQIPRLVIEGYRTIFAEIDQQAADPDIVVVQIGVGGLAAAAARQWPSRRPVLIGVEPAGAACALAAVRAGEPTLVPGPHRSIMAGLNCGLVSEQAFALLRDRYSAILAIDDETARDAMRRLAAAGIVAGESGAAGLGGLFALAADAETRKTLGIGPRATALVINTEGATDPDGYTRIVSTSARDGLMELSQPPARNS
jgi:diaminopropionate ammonia-lyase